MAGLPFPKDPFICPKKGINPNQSYCGDGMFRPAILLDREVFGCLRVSHNFGGNGMTFND